MEVFWSTPKYGLQLYPWRDFINLCLPFVVFRLLGILAFMRDTINESQSYGWIPYFLYLFLFSWLIRKVGSFFLSSPEKGNLTFFFFLLYLTWYNFILFFSRSKLEIQALIYKKGNLFILKRKYLGQFQCSTKWIYSYQS